MMFTAKRKKTTALAAAVAGLAIALAGCSSSNPLDSGDTDSSAPSSGTIVVGSQAYFSNEIIAEVYSQALENAGYTVKRQFNIGQRDAYMPSIESGDIHLFLEYTGNLLQWFDKNAEARSSADVYTALQKALPDNLAVLDQADATDQDSYTVTAAFAKKYSLASIRDLTGVSEKLTLGGNPELAERPYGPKGLKSIYGVDVDFSPTGDITVDELVAGTINIADVYTADSRIKTDDLVSLTDPKAMFLASNVVPLVSKDIADEIAGVINPVSAKLTSDALVNMNVQSTQDKKSPGAIATQFLADNGLS